MLKCRYSSRQANMILFIYKNIEIEEINYLRKIVLNYKVFFISC